jgi:hypothetical protein
MAYLGAGVIALGLLYLLARAYTGMDAGALVRSLRYIVGGGLIGVGIILSLVGRWGLGLFMIAMGGSALPPAGSVRSISAAPRARPARFRPCAPRGSRCGSITTAVT